MMFKNKWKEKLVETGEMWSNVGQIFSLDTVARFVQIHVISPVTNSQYIETRI